MTVAGAEEQSFAAREWAKPLPERERAAVSLRSPPGISGLPAQALLPGRQQAWVLLPLLQRGEPGGRCAQFPQPVCVPELPSARRLAWKYWKD